MTHERWMKLNQDDSEHLTEAEIAEGWHFCPEWDGLLVGREMGEWSYCTCRRVKTAFDPRHYSIDNGE